MEDYFSALIKAIIPFFEGLAVSYTNIHFVFKWAIVLILVNVILYIGNFIRQSRARRFVDKYYNINLIINYQYLDHTIDDYSLADSKLELSGEYCLTEDILEGDVSRQDVILNQSLYGDTKGLQSGELLAVSFFSHNREQELIKDEKHWFTIKFYKTNAKTRTKLEKIWVEDKNRPLINQPVRLNENYPFVLGLKISVMLIFRKPTPYVICQDDNFIIDYVVSSSDIDFPVANASRLQTIVMSLIKGKGYEVVSSIYFTDIGVDVMPLYLRLFAYVEVEPPKGYKNNSLCHKVRRIPTMIKNSNLSPAFRSYLLKMHINLT
jgi:hypothetical protein